MIITIDGYSWLGKSYIGERLAMEMGIDYFPTGILVRFVASELSIDKRKKIAYEDAIKKAIKVLENTDIKSIKYQQLYTQKIECHLKMIAKFPFVTSELNKILKKYIANKDIVLDGHFTFVLFPEAYRKFYFLSTIEKRAALVSKVKKIDIGKAIEYIQYRDSFEENIVIPENVHTIDPFSYSTDELIRTMMEEIMNE